MISSWIRAVTTFRIRCISTHIYSGKEPRSSDSASLVTDLDMLGRLRKETCCVSAPIAQLVEQLICSAASGFNTEACCSPRWKRWGELVSNSGKPVQVTLLAIPSEAFRGDLV